MSYYYITPSVSLKKKERGQNKIHSQIVGGGGDYLHYFMWPCDHKLLNNSNPNISYSLLLSCFFFLLPTFMLPFLKVFVLVMQLDFEFSAAARKWSSLHGEQHFRNNLSLLLRWSPFATETELLKQVSFRCLQGCCFLSVSFLVLFIINFLFLFAWLSSFM